MLRIHLLAPLLDQLVPRTFREGIGRQPEEEGKRGIPAIKSKALPMHKALTR